LERAVNSPDPAGQSARVDEDEPNEPGLTALKAALEDLEDALTEGAAEAQDLVASHPMIATLSALALGIAIGVMWRTRR
jgi:hypothetical protein